MRNIFQMGAGSFPEELTEVLVESSHVRIEQIVSDGQVSPEDFWYDQDSNEWVILLKGSAALLFEGENSPVKLLPGDYITIPAHVKHRVEWTDPDGDTVWLAVHYGGG